MLHAKTLVEVDRLGDQVGVELVEFLREQSGEVFGNLVRLLQTTAETVSKSSDVGNVVVLANLGLFLHVALELGLPVLAEQPLEYRFLNLLIILTLKILVREKLHRPNHKYFTATLRVLEEATHWSVRRERNWST